MLHYIKNGIKKPTGFDLKWLVTKGCWKKFYSFVRLIELRAAKIKCVNGGNGDKSPPISTHAQRRTDTFQRKRQSKRRKLQSINLNDCDNEK